MDKITDIEFADAWLAKLRDPETKQTRFKLRDWDGGRCCLGVACDVAEELGWGTWVGGQEHEERWVFQLDENEFRSELSQVDRENLDVSHIRASGVLPWALAYRLGVTCVATVGERNLTELNDEKKMTLPGIADVIENELVDRNGE